jgi:TPR repeat protein
MLYDLGVKHQERNGLFSYGQLLRSAVLPNILPDPLLAAALFDKAATAEHPYACYNLGMMFYAGEIGAKKTQQPDYTQAMTYLQRAAEMNVYPALTNLGHMFYHGLGTDKDMTQAMDYYQRAAEVKDPKALMALGNIYATGAPPKMVKNPFKAFEYWYHAASLAQRPGTSGSIRLESDASLVQAADPYTASRALLNIGNCYFLGIGLPEAKPDTEDDDDQGHLTDIPCRPNYLMALEFWELAAKSDPSNMKAWLHLGNMYFDGIGGATGVSKDLERAAYYYSTLLQHAEHASDASGLTKAEQAEVCGMAESLLESCHHHLTGSTKNTRGTTSETESEQKSTSIADRLWKDAMLGRKKASATSNKSFWSKWLNPFKDPSEVADYEQGQLDGMQHRDRLQDVKMNAERHHWRYVEDFAQAVQNRSSYIKE